MSISPVTTVGGRVDRLLVFNLATDADDPILGFTTEWLRALAARAGAIDVVTMRVGRLELPANVQVYSVGKERGFSEPRRAVEFYRILRRLLRTHRYDGCFAHMMPLFAAMGAPLLRHRHIPITLWYAHGATPLTLRIAERLVDTVVTSSPGAFRLSSAKLQVLGQGIDTDVFRPLGGRGSSRRPFTMIAVGRIAPVKRIEMMVDVLAELSAAMPEACVRLRLVGPVEAKDQAYADAVSERVSARGVGTQVEWVGAVARRDLPSFFADADVALNLTSQGSFDKSALEAMACGLPLVTTNPGLQALIRKVDERLVPSSDTAGAVAEACRRLAERGDAARRETGSALRAIVVAEHGLQRLADLLVAHVAAGAFRRSLVHHMGSTSLGSASIGRIAAELWRGKSLLRAQANAVLSTSSGVVHGMVVDLACGNSPSYRRVLGPGITWFGIERSFDTRPDVVADAFAPLPLRSSCADAVVLSWALYISREPVGVLVEAARVVRPGGRLLLTTPFVFPLSPEPSDYWRFTEDGLRWLLHRAGFEHIEVVPLGDRWSSSVTLLEPFLRPRRLVGLVAGLLAVALDRVTRRLPYTPRPCPAGYFVVARAPLSCAGGHT